MNARREFAIWTALLRGEAYPELMIPPIARSAGIWAETKGAGTTGSASQSTPPSLPVRCMTELKTP